MFERYHKDLKERGIITSEYNLHDNLFLWLFGADEFLLLYCHEHLIRPDRKFCVNADKLSSRKEEQLRGFFGLDTGRLNSAYPPVFRGEKRYARAA